MPEQAPVTLHLVPSPLAKWLSHCIKDLDLYARPHKPRSRVWQNDAPTLAEELKKHVTFYIEGDLGDGPTLSPGLTPFLAEGSAKGQDNALGTVTPIHEEPLLLCPTESSQHCPTHTGGARPKTLAHPSASQSLSWPQSKPEEPYPVNHLHRWIHTETEKISHFHWWKEMKPSWRLSMGPHLIREGLSDAEALQQDHWQVVVFRLLLVKSEALGGWVPHSHSVGSTLQTSYPPLMLPAQRISMPGGRRKHWP